MFDRVTAESPKDPADRPLFLHAIAMREYLEGGGKKRDLKYDLEGGWFRVVAAEATPVGGAAPASPAAEEAEARRSDDDA